MSALRQHALSAAFPAMPATDFQSLCADIETHGLRQPIVTHQGEVLDGWHRYTACLETGRDPSFVEFDGGDPAAFVLSLNLHRRNLTASQRALAVVACTEWRPKGGDQAKQSAPSAEALSERADVSTRTIEHAKAAQKAGLGKAVISGEVSVKRAAEVAKLPKADRKAALKDPDWQANLERKSEPTPEQEVELDDASERMADLAADYEVVLRIVEADDKLAEARLIIKEQRAKYEQLEGLYNAQRIELATMTREAKRWQRKAEAA